MWTLASLAQHAAAAHGNPYPRFQGHGVIIASQDAIDVLCAQLTRNLYAIAKFLVMIIRVDLRTCTVICK